MKRWWDFLFASENQETVNRRNGTDTERGLMLMTLRWRQNTIEMMGEIREISFGGAKWQLIQTIFMINFLPFILVCFLSFHARPSTAKPTDGASKNLGWNSIYGSYFASMCFHCGWISTISNMKIMSLNGCQSCCVRDRRNEKDGKKWQLRNE